MNSFIRYLWFFLGDFHNGAINHVIHFVGFTLFGYGLAKQNWTIVLISPFVMEMGHIYNYSRGIHRTHALKIIPLQWAAGLVFAGLIYLLVKIFGL